MATLDQAAKAAELFEGAVATIDITDPRSGEVITADGETVTKDAASWMADLVYKSEATYDEFATALVLDAERVARRERQQALFASAAPGWMRR